MAEEFDENDVAVNPEDVLNNLDFNVDEEYKPEPLIPKGTYHGVATKVSFMPSQFCIVWD